MVSAAVATVSLSVGVSASADTVPYAVPVQLPSATASPAVNPAAPYTPLVLSLINQLLPSNPPTLAQVQNAATLLHGGNNSTCNNVGPVAAPTGTIPGIVPLCWTDAAGVLPTSGPNAGTGDTGTLTTAAPSLLSIAGSFDRRLQNAWGQVQGAEARNTMVTGMFGPQTDLARIPNWRRALQTNGEDPLLSSEMVAAQIDGIQGRGAMAEMKHFAGYAGNLHAARVPGTAPTVIQDQAFHELLLPPFEGGFVQAKAAAGMCAYQTFSVTSPALVRTISPVVGTSPFGVAGTSWPLNEAHTGCQQPLLTDILRNQWGSVAMIGSDYYTQDTNAMFQGSLDQEMPASSAYDGGTSATSVSSSTCADSAGTWVDCSAPGAVRISGIPNNFQNSGMTGCPEYGCTLEQAVVKGGLPLTMFKQSLARILYQEERFGMLGCNDTPVAATCTNPGGTGGDRSGTAPLPAGPTTGATPQQNIGTKAGDAAVVEKAAEEGAVLLKNTGGLPISTSNLTSGIAISGPGAEYTIAEPQVESATGFPDRIAINPLQQLQSLSGKPGAFTFSAANGPTGTPLSSSVLSTSNSSVTGSLARTGPTSGNDASLDFTTASSNGQLAPGSYTWSGYVYVPTADTYTFRFQQSATVPAANVTFALGASGGQPASTATPRTLAPASTFYFGQNRGTTPVPVGVTRAGYTEAGLTNRQFAAGVLGPGYYPVTITFNNTTSAPASFRFADSRADSDIADAADAARGKSLAIVFANDNGVTIVHDESLTGSSPTTQISPLVDSQVKLINAVAAANPNTVVVLNTGSPVIVKPWIDNANIKAVLEMWNAGSEGGTATARLLLGQANPSGKTAVTWPVNGSDTLWGYNQPTGLYPGDTPGTHPERLNGLPSNGTSFTEGIYIGYRYFDKLGIAAQFPFGFGLSYTSFKFSGLKVTPRFDGTVDVDYDITNTGSVAGDQVGQVYLGPGPDIPNAQQAVRSLAAFDRVSLDAGQTKHVTSTINARAFQYWDTNNQKWVTNYGPRTVWVGDADSPDRLPLSASTAPLAATSTTGRIGGSVPATLSLTLGTPPTFGTFTPGAAKNYTASTLANVISTAGDGTLSVSDPSTTATGRLLNGSFSLPQPLQANASSPAGVGGALATVGGSTTPTTLLTYNQPVSNDPVSIAFQQSIASTDALRTGAYSKTLTFTLSTTQP